jgi:hypothetical protein
LNAKKRAGRRAYTSNRLAGHHRLSILEAWDANNWCRAFQHQLKASVLCARKLDIGGRIHAIETDTSTNGDDFWCYGEATPEAKVDGASL